MYEGRKGGSKESSSKGNKQRQTGLCLPVTLLKWGGLLQEAQHTPTHTLTHTHWGAQTTLTSTHAHTQPFSLRPNGDPFIPLLRHTHTHASKPSPGRQQMHMWVICVLCVHALLCVFVHTWICQHQCQGVGYCCLGPNPCHHPSPHPPIASLSAHEETGRRAQRRWRVNGEEREKRGREEARERKTKGEKKRATEGEGLDSCLLPSLEASSSQS